MTVRRFAMIAGVIYLVVGALGFIPALVHAPEMPRDMAIELGYGRLMGIFPINVLHNLVHLSIGAWGVLGGRSFAGARGFARGLAILYALLAVLGLIPATETLFGLAPLYGHDIWLHAATALAAAYFGFGPPARPPERGA